VTDEGTRRSERVEILATILLALATVATAWSGYQASRWNGEQAKAAAKASALRIESVKADGLANAQSQIDVAVFTQWVDAYARGEKQLADFYLERFRAEFKPAVDAWIATRPLQNPDAPLTPFAMPEYRLEAREEAGRLEAASDVAAAAARESLQRATNYVLAVVFFAAALFLGGMSARLRTLGLRRALAIVGLVVFLGAAAWIATFPVSVSV